MSRFLTCRWSRCRKAYSGVRSSCLNGILLTLVTSGAKYRSGSNVHRTASDSQDRMCCSMDRGMDVCSCADAPFRLESSPGLFRPALLLPWESCRRPPRAVDLALRGDVGLVWTQVSCWRLMARLPDVSGVVLIYTQ